MAFIALLRSLTHAYQEGKHPGDSDIESMIPKLEADLGSSARVDTLRRLHDILREPNEKDRVAAAHIVSIVSLDIFGHILECVEHPIGEGTALCSRTEGKPLLTKVTIQDIAEKVLLLIAESVSPKELNLMALENARCFTSPRTLGIVLSVLRRSLECMELPQRTKFLGASMPPALDILRRIVTAGEKYVETMQETDLVESGPDVGYTDSNRALPPNEGYEKPSPAAVEAAGRAMEMAASFIGPLLRQTRNERTGIERRATVGIPTDSRAIGAKGVDQEWTTDNTSEAKRSQKEEQMALNRSEASFLGFAFSALNIASTNLVCRAASQPDNNLVKAQGRLVDLILTDSIIDLQFALEHIYRLSYSQQWKRIPDGSTSRRLQTHERRGRTGVGELLATTEALPDTLVGVSAMAHLVMCDPMLSNRWLPLVWSHKTVHRLFLPYAENLMGSKSTRLRGKGLELACSLAEGLGVWPDQTGQFAFTWEPGDEIEGEVWAEPDVENGLHSRSGRSQQPMNPHRVNICIFLRILIDVVVTCPLAPLRTRGHAAMGAFMGAVDVQSRFELLRHLATRCPWPSATGLLLDAFRREMDRGSRQPRLSGSKCHGFKADVGNSGGTRTSQEEGDSAENRSPFVSSLAKEFVCEQLQRACRKGSPSLMLVDMDTRMGALGLARYAHMLDRTAGGFLELRKPERLNDNRRLVQGLVDSVRQASSSEEKVPHHFKLFLLEDAAEQCLSELLLD